MVLEPPLQKGLRSRRAAGFSPSCPSPIQQEMVPLGGPVINVYFFEPLGEATQSEGPPESPPSRRFRQGAQAGRLTSPRRAVDRRASTMSPFFRVFGMDPSSGLNEGELFCGAVLALRGGTCRRRLRAPNPPPLVGVKKKKKTFPILGVPPNGSLCPGRRSSSRCDWVLELSAALGILTAPPGPPNEGFLFCGSHENSTRASPTVQFRFCSSTVTCEMISTCYTDRWPRLLTGPGSADSSCRACSS